MNIVTSVSVIITTRNEGTKIGACLRSIQQQTYKGINVIVVDNNSSDSTKEISRQFTKFVYDKGPERSTQRNYGATKANGDYVLFLDADMELTPDVIKQCVDTCENKDIVAVVIPEISFGSGYWAACKTLERSFYLNIDWIEAARFFRMDTFRSIGGYDESLTGPEDFDLPQRIKSRYGNSSIGRIKSYIRHNEGNLSLGKTLSKKFYYGKKMHGYGQKKENRKYARLQANPIKRYVLFFSDIRRLIRNPVIGLGMLFMKTSELVALAMGYLFGILA